MYSGLAMLEYAYKVKSIVASCYYPKWLLPAHTSYAWCFDCTGSAQEIIASNKQHIYLSVAAPDSESRGNDVVLPWDKSEPNYKNLTHANTYAMLHILMITISGQCSVEINWARCFTRIRWNWVCRNTCLEMWNVPCVPRKWQLSWLPVRWILGWAQQGQDTIAREVTKFRGQILYITRRTVGRARNAMLYLTYQGHRARGLIWV